MECIDENKKNQFRLILHIGMGKTGTTSIQNMLNEQRDSLIEQGIWYLGSLLDKSPIKRYSWQNTGDMSQIVSLSTAEAIAQFVDALTATKNMVTCSGGNAAILSNESFFHSNFVRLALELLAAQGWNIEVIMYVRRYDEWLKSAYIQWGIKDKTYQGRLLSFSEWIENTVWISQVFDDINSWMSLTEVKCIIKNYDVITDVIQDFCETTGCFSSHISYRRDNQVPSAEELLLRALFNNTIQSQANPNEFNRLMNAENLDFSSSLATFLFERLPTNEDMEKIVDSHAVEIEKINRMFIDSGQKVIPLHPNLNCEKVDLAKITAVMFQILVNQAKKIEALEQHLRQF